MVHARIEICPHCGKHGHIVLADGFVGLEFCFQRHALGLVRSGVERFENISPQDGEQLTQAILDSMLPLEWYLVPLVYHWQIEQWNRYRINNEDFHPDGPHAFLQRSVDANEIPNDFRSFVQNIYAS